MTFEILWKGWIEGGQVKMSEVPSTLKPFTIEENERIKKKFEEVGATVEIK